MALSIIVHEAGHGASCIRKTGLIGAIRPHLHWGFLSIGIDVTPIRSLKPAQRIEVHLAGPLSQLAFASGLSFFEATRPAALLIACVGAAALLPIPGFDGFWVLSDLLGKSPRGPLRLPRKGDVVAPILCWSLLSGTIIWDAKVAQRTVVAIVNRDAQLTEVLVLGVVFQIAAATLFTWATANFLLGRQK